MSESVSPEETAAKRIERLWAIHEIRQLAYKYAFAFDSRNAEELLALWDETAEPATFPEIDIHTIRNDFDRWFDIGPSVLFVGNHLIEFDNDEQAHGSVYCLGQIDFRDQFVDHSILYQDRYVCRDGRWLFVTRRHELWFGQARDRHPLHQQPANWPENVVGRGTLPESLRSYRT